MNTLFRTAFLAALGAGIVSPALAQSAPLTRDSRLPSSDLLADLATLRDAYVTLHPGLYRYATPAEVTARFDAVAKYFSSDRTLAEAFLALTRLTAAVKCGHSYPNFWNQSTKVANALFEGRDKLPFEFRWIDGKMIVTRDVSAAPQLPAGTEVRTINGVPAHTILDSLMTLARADGSNDGKRRAYLEVQKQYRYHAFDILYPLVFPVRDSVFTLSVLKAGTTRAETVRVVALDGATRRGRGTRADAPDRNAPQWTVAITRDVPVVRMPTWALYNSTWNAKAFTDSVVDAAIREGRRDIVLDLRGNEGGNDLGNLWLERVISTPVELPRYDRMVRAQSVPERLRPVLDTWDRTFFDWGTDAARRVDSLFFRLTRWDDESGGNVLAPRGTRYTGRLWVIVGPENSSATFQFALMVKQSRTGTLVGQTTGGNRRGINGSAFFFVRLPRTGLEVDLPLVAGIPPTAQPDAGVEPDYVVTPTPGQIARGEDAELSRIFAEIARRSQR